MTIPHKENLLRFVKERGGRVDELSERIGAANTLMVGSNGVIACCNTDCAGAIDALIAGMGSGREGLEGKRAAVLGAGGVARAVVVGLLDVGMDVTIINRTPGRSQQLVDGLA